jgi:hypothetical protein
LVDAVNLVRVNCNTLGYAFQNERLRSGHHLVLEILLDNLLVFVVLNKLLVLGIVLVCLFQLVYFDLLYQKVYHSLVLGPVRMTYARLTVFIVQLAPVDLVDFKATPHHLLILVFVGYVLLHDCTRVNIGVI